MTQYKSVNVKFSSLQLDKLKPATKNETGVTLKILQNLNGATNNETNFPCKLLSINVQVIWYK